MDSIICHNIPHIAPASTLMIPLCHIENSSLVIAYRRLAYPRGTRPPDSRECGSLLAQWGKKRSEESRARGERRLSVSGANMKSNQTTTTIMPRPIRGNTIYIIYANRNTKQIWVKRSETSHTQLSKECEWDGKERERESWNEKIPQENFKINETRNKFHGIIRSLNAYVAPCIATTTTSGMRWK